MANTESNEIDAIIWQHIQAIANVFAKIKTNGTFDSRYVTGMIEQLDLSERLVKEICINFVTEILKWFRREYNIPSHRDMVINSDYLATLQESFNLD